MEINPELHLVINGKIYERTAFAPEQVQAIQMINHADQQLHTQRANLEVMTMGRDQMVSMLLDNIKDVEPIGDLPEQEEN